MVIASVGWIGEGESAAAGPAELISRDPSSGVALTSGDFQPSVSGDGNIVVFNSSVFTNAPNFPFDEDVWVRDRAAGTTTHVPQPNPQFGQTIAASDGGVLSRDGCHVVFWGKYFFDFPAGEWNLYEWNRCIPGSPSVEIAGSVLDDDASTQFPTVSADGRYVAYIAAQIEGPPLVARIDTTTGVTSVLRHPFSAVFQVDISDDGGFVAVDGSLFVGSVQTEQVLGWTAPCTTTGAAVVCTTEIVSLTNSGAVASGFSGSPSVSADGRYVAFDSDALELGGVPSGLRQVYVRDRVAEVTRLVTDTPGQPKPQTGVGEISPDGTQIAILQESGGETSNVYVARSTSGFFDTTAFDLVSFGVNDQPLSSGANGPSMSSTGRYVAFSSRDSDELSGVPTTVFQSDVWLRERPIALDITATLNFGTIDVGSQSPPQNAVVTNTSGVAITIGSVTQPDAPFTITANGCSGVVLQPGDSCSITVVFRPTVPGSSSSSVTVSGDGLAVSVSLVGIGRPLATAGSLSIAPAAIDFGTAAVGSSLGARTFSISNPGQTAVTFSGVSLNNVGADQFAIVANTCGSSLAGGASCTISVSSTVTREGSFSAILSIRGTAGEVAQGTLRVRGTTELFDPTLLMNPGVVSPGEVTTAVGTGFPPNIDVQLSFADETVPLTTVHTDADGAFKFNFLILRNGIRIGGRQIIAIDQPQFSGVFAPLLIDLATYRPSGFSSPAITSGVRSLFSRGG